MTCTSMSLSACYTRLINLLAASWCVRRENTNKIFLVGLVQRQNGTDVLKTDRVVQLAARSMKIGYFPLTQVSYFDGVLQAAGLSVYSLCIPQAVAFFRNREEQNALRCFFSNILNRYLRSFERTLIYQIAVTRCLCVFFFFFCNKITPLYNRYYFLDCLRELSKT